MTDFPATALSVRQPWAWAIIHAGKDIENRSAIAINSGRMRNDCRIAIHASKGMTRDEYESASSFIESLGITCPRPDALVRGALIGSVYVKEFTKRSDSDWFFGPRGLVLQNPAPISPVPCSGELGYFRWTQSGEIELPKPWMASWPENPRRSKSKPIDQGDRLL